ncbi:MAG: hypothetical protein C3F13_19540 [Anaerolineales bacterium]|nr:hypothetical protein [Anaerolineae bacterium]PWB49589.1 MAG: hypothetical protein C3F13_19540 [Anaerolineales bacterium]
MGKTGRRIWYGIAIFLSGLAILMSLAGIVGVWLTQSAVSNSAVQLLDSLSNITGNMRSTAQAVDQKLSDLQDISSSIASASTTLSQQVADEGLIKLLLPEEQVQKLTSTFASVKEAVSTLRDMLTSVKTIYQTIDSLPFVNLPALSQDQIDKFTGSVNTVQTALDEVTTAITAFRAGASEQIGRVKLAADQFTNRLGESRSNLAGLDTRLANIQELLLQLKQIAVVALFMSALFGTLFLVWVSYTQIEVIRVYALRWKATRVVALAETTSPQEAAFQQPPAIDSGSAPLENQDNK